MEILLVQKQCIRIKGKRATLLVDPYGLTTKTPADAIITLTKNPVDTTKVEGSRITIAGPGEYEVGGVKVSGIGSSENFVYNIDIDGLTLLLGKAEHVEKLQEKVRQCQVAVLHSIKAEKSTLLTSLECSIGVLYGEGAAEFAKVMSKETPPVNKIAIAADKLPAEMEIVVLG